MVEKTKNKEKRYVIDLPFVADSVGINKKDILNYIKGKSQPIIGDDFYYSYVHKDGVLTFTAFASEKHISGNYLPTIAPALLRKGKYFYGVEGGVYYFIENNEGRIKTEVGYEEKEGYVDITKVEELTKGIPDTIRLRWSLQPEVARLNLIGMIAFILSIVFLFTASIRKNEPMITQVATVTAEAMKESLPDVTGLIEDIGREVVNGKGYIEKAQLQQDGMQFVIKFKNENYIQSFISRRGGKYENGSVVYTRSFDNF
jgi:hypothetical protein